MDCNIKERTYIYRHGIHKKQVDLERQSKKVSSVFCNRPNENPKIGNFELRQLVQVKSETFSTFCNKVEAGGKACTFCECGSDCSAEEYAIRDQIVIGRTNENICKKAMIKNWKLAELRQKEMKHESAAAGEEKISNCDVNKVGVYFYQRIKNEKTKLSTKKCYRCGLPLSTKHIKSAKPLKQNVAIATKQVITPKFVNRKM